MITYYEDDIERLDTPKSKKVYYADEIEPYSPDQEVVEPEPEGDWNITRGLKSGLWQTVATPYALGSMVAKAGHADPAARVLADKARGLYEKAEKYQPDTTFKELVEDPSFKGATDWALYTIGNFAPSIVAGFTGAGVGAKIATKAFLKNAIKRGMAKGLSKKAATEAVTKQVISKVARRGAAAGLVTSTAGLETAPMYMEDVRRHGVENAKIVPHLVTGGLAGLVELGLGGFGSGHYRLIKKFYGEAGQELAKKSSNAAVRMIKEIGRQSGGEAFQELAQEELAIANELWTSTPEERSTFEFFSAENLMRGAESAAGGGIMGVPGGTVSGMIPSRNIQATAENNLSDEKTYSENRDAFINQTKKGLADGVVSIEDVKLAKQQHEEGENPDIKVSAALDEIIKDYEEVANPDDESLFDAGQEAYKALQNFENDVKDLDMKSALEAKDTFIKDYPWLEDQANEAIVNAQPEVVIEPEELKPEVEVKPEKVVEKLPEKPDKPKKEKPVPEPPKPEKVEGVKAGEAVEAISREPKQELLKKFDKEWKAKSEEDEEAWFEMVDHFESIRNENQPKIDALNKEYAPLKSKRDKESVKRKKAIKEEIAQLKGEPESLRSHYEDKIIKTQIALQEEAKKKAIEAGLSEDAAEDFIDDFSIETSGEQPYVGRNYGKTKQEIFDELIEEYKSKEPEKPAPKPEGKEAWEKLIDVQKDGSYFNLNPVNGKFAFYIPLKPIVGKVDPRYGGNPVKGNIADLELNFSKLPEKIQKVYGKWRNDFAKKNPDKYNELINQEPTIKPPPSPEKTGVALEGKARGEEKPSPKKVLGKPKAEGKKETKPEKLEDFGEKIGGARKDYYAQFADRMKESKELDIATEPLSKTFPTPNYQKLIDEGTDPWIVAFVRSARDEIPNKPRQSWKLRRFVDQVKMLRGFADDLLSGKVEKDVLQKKLDEKEYSSLKRTVGGRTDLYVEVGHDKSLKGVTFQKHHYSIYRGEENVDKWIIEKSKKATIFSNMPRELGIGNTRKEALEDFKSKYVGFEEKTKTKGVKFDLYSKGSKKDIYIGKKIGRHHVDLAKFDTIKEAREYLKNNQAELEEKLKQYRTLPSERRAINRERIGKDHRNGKDVTPEMFTDSFGFRGVEFGNWVNTEERQDNLNRAYDALMDLSLILNIPSQAISLNGELGLAFGARGIGGKQAPAAHYEPNKIVINLTKKGGPGSLGHEWWHGLDNYFSRGRGKALSYISENARKLEGDPTRIEILNAIKNIVDTLKKTGLLKRSAELDKRRTKQYWGTVREMTARSFENYIIERLSETDALNDYLANIASAKEYASDMIGGLLSGELTAKDMYPYLLDDEIESVTKAFDRLFDVMESRKTDKGTELYQIGKSIPVVGNDSLIDLLRKSPPLKKMAIGLSKDGSVWVRNKQGKGFNVKSVVHIEPDKAALKVSYGRMLNTGEFIKGKYQDGTIELHRATADEWTLTHETFHYLEDSGLLTPTDIGTLRDHIKKLERNKKWDSQGREVGGDEDRAIFVIDFIRDRSQKGRVGRILQKIADIIDMLVNLVHKTARGVMRDVESGKALEKESKEPSKGIEQYEIGQKPLPDFMQDFLNKAKSEKPTEFGSKKDVPPPKDPDKIDSWLKDQADTFTKGLLHYTKGQPHLNWFERIIASPEWYQHPVMQQLVKVFTRNRSELYHHFFNHLNQTNEENEVVKTLKDLKHKGVSRGQRLRKKTSKEYQFLLNMIEEVDQKWQKSSEDTLEEHYAKVERHYRSKGATDDTINAWRVQREAYDRALALMQTQMEQLIRNIAPQGPRSKLKAIKFGDESTKNYGKQYLESPDKFEEFFTVTYKTSHKWGLPSTEGINYVVGNFKEGTDRGVQSVNFSKNLFDEESANEWWKENRKNISLLLKESELEQSKELKKTLTGVMTLMGNLQGSYAPRVRTPGSWAVQAWKKEGKKTRTFREHRGSWLSADRLRKKLKKEGWNVRDPHEFPRLPESVYQDIQTVSLTKAIEEASRRVSEHKGIHSGLALSFNEELLGHVSDLIKARGFRSTMIHRKGEGVVEGYNTDPLERFLIYTNNVAGGMSKAKVAQLGTELILGEYKDNKKVGGIDPAREPRAFEVATEYLKEQLRNIEPSDRLIGLAKSITTFKYLGFNLRSIGVNLTAMITTAPASIHQYALGGKGSFTKIGKELAKAGKDYAKVMAGKKLSDPTDQAFIEDQQRLGYSDPQYTREALGNLRQTHQKVWPAMMDASMYLFGKSEEWNRGATMLAAFRLAKKSNDYADAVNLAKEASDRAHALYGKATLPTWAQGKNPFAKGAQLFYMYSKFGHNYVQMCYDLGMRKHNIKGFAFAMLSPLVLAGGAAFPFKDEIFFFVGAILQAIGIDQDPEKWVWDSVRRYLGDKGELITRHGVTGAAGVDISGSLSIGIGVPTGLGDLAGAAGGVVEDVQQAYRFAKSGQPGRAFEKVIPRGFENPLRALRESKSGLVTQRGKRLWTPQGKPYHPSARETALRVAGFRSAEEATLSERTWESKREEGTFNERKTRIYEAYRAYLADKDSEKHKQIMKMVRQYNKDVRGKNVSRIKMSSMRRQIRSMRRPSKRERGRLK